MKITVGDVSVILVDSNDRIVGKIKKCGSFEPDSLDLWADWCKDGGSVLDIGGYTGLYSLIAASLGCNVTTIEPMDFLAERIRVNCLVNIVKVKIINAAASDKTGTTTIYTNGATFTSGASLKVGKWKNKQIVNTIRIDDLNVSNLTAIKIDVEEHEECVLNGGLELIAKYRPKIIIEALRQPAIDAVKTILSDYNHVATLDSRNMIMIPN